MESYLQENFTRPDAIISTVEGGGALVALLDKSNPDCPLIGKEIKIIKRLGEGKNGTVYSITMRGDTESQFAMKKVVDDVPAEPCKLIFTYKTFIPGDYVCDESIIEPVISAFASFFVSRELCPHFVHVLSIAHCEGGEETYTFMEIIDSDLIESIIEGSGITDPIIFQVMVALQFLQTPWKICHQDLSLRNVFMKKSDHIAWKGINMGSAEWWRYNIDGEDYYIPRQEYVVKLGDWGFSTKYSYPIVVRKDVIDGEYNDYNIPTEFSSVYDMLFFLSVININAGNKNVVNVVQYIQFIVNHRNIKRFFNAHRPIPSKLKSDVTPKTFLKQFFAKFKQPPPEKSRILDIATL